MVILKVKSKHCKICANVLRHWNESGYCNACLRKSPKYKAKRREYHQRPEYKAKKREYQQSPEYKAKQKLYYQNRVRERNVKVN